MIISHSQLQDCLNNPTAWVESRLSSGGSFFRLGYDQCLRLAIYRFHRDGDVQVARQHLERLLERNKLVNVNRVDDTIRRLGHYLTWLQDAQITVTNHRLRFRLEVGSDLVLGGEVGRIDMTPQGYRALIFGPVRPGWDGELRMPLIQRAVASAIGRPEDEFVVGIQELDASNMAVRRYSISEIEEATGSARALESQIMAELDRLQTT